MTEAEGDAFHPLGSHDREELSRTVLTFLDEMESLLLSGLGEEISGSRAEQLATGNFPSTSQGHYPGRNAMETALFATLAGLDHTRLLMRSIVQEDTTFALATLTRGAIEAYARAWWLIEDESDNEMVLRWLSAIAAELETLQRHEPGRPLKELRGRVSYPFDEREKVLDDIENLSGERKPLKIGYAALATGLQKNFDPHARTNYSHLSGVAHGESLAINGFIGLDDGAGKYIVGLPVRWGLSFVSQAFGAASFTGRKVLELLGRGVGESHPCAVAHDLAATAVATMMARALASQNKSPEANVD